MGPKLPSLIVLLSSAALIGCTGQHPRLSHPGTIEQQRLRALIHDPYADPDMGPKDPGMRPQEFQKPLPEPVRNRIYADSWWWRR
ncbi:MAG TPA: membrane or secreted protein [Pirellulaceae bacterium]|jgi:hypothetical protein